MMTNDFAVGGTRAMSAVPQRAPMIPQSLDQLAATVAALKDAVQRAEKTFERVLFHGPEDNQKNAMVGQIASPSSDVATSIRLRCEEIHTLSTAIHRLCDIADC